MISTAWASSRYSGHGPSLRCQRDEPVLADRALERRHARDEQHDDDHRVGGDQAGQPPGSGRDAARRLQRARALGGHREADRDAEPESRRAGEHVRHHGPPPRRAPLAHPRRRSRWHRLGGVDPQ